MRPNCGVHLVGEEHCAVLHAGGGACAAAREAVAPIVQKLVRMRIETGGDSDKIRLRG